MKIVNVINKLPWHESRTWETRSLDSIDKFIAHQELGNGTVEQVNNYHITPGDQNHLSKRGAPHYAYHYGIERDGTLFQANELTHRTWHTRGQNKTGISCMLVGDFTGPGHTGKNEPTQKQLDSLEFLIDTLLATFPKLNVDNVFGHCDFGKPACPGDLVMETINKYKITNQLTENS